MERPTLASRDPNSHTPSSAISTRSPRLGSEPAKIQNDLIGLNFWRAEHSGLPKRDSSILSINKERSLSRRDLSHARPAQPGTLCRGVAASPLKVDVSTSTGPRRSQATRPEWLACTLPHPMEGRMPHGLQLSAEREFSRIAAPTASDRSPLALSPDRARNRRGRHFVRRHEPPGGIGPGRHAVVQLRGRGTFDRPGSRGWQVDYRLRHEGPTEIIAAPAEIQAKVEGWVSNSRIASHAVPRMSSLSRSQATTGWSGHERRDRDRPTKINAVANDSPCRSGRVMSRTVLLITAAKARGGVAPSGPAQPALSIAPGAVHARSAPVRAPALTLRRLRPACSAKRTVDACNWGRRSSATCRPDRSASNTSPCRKRTGPAPSRTGSTPAISFRVPIACTWRRMSPATSRYRFPERPVRYATKMRLKYWYLIASGTDGGCRVRITQYQETPHHLQDPLRGRPGRAPEQGGALDQGRARSSRPTARPPPGPRVPGQRPQRHRDRRSLDRRRQPRASSSRASGRA